MQDSSFVFGNSVLEIRECFKYNDFNNEGQAHRFF